jgi:hypothetical protein
MRSVPASSKNVNTRGPDSIPGQGQTQHFGSRRRKFAGHNVPGECARLPKAKCDLKFKHADGHGKMPNTLISPFKL